MIKQTKKVKKVRKRNHLKNKRTTSPRMLHGVYSFHGNFIEVRPY